MLSTKTRPSFCKEEQEVHSWKPEKNELFGSENKQKMVQKVNFTEENMSHIKVVYDEDTGYT